MRYTENQLTKTELSSKADLLKYALIKLPTAPYRLCTEVSRKILFLPSKDVMSIFTVASGIGAMLLVPDVIGVAKTQSLASVQTFTFVKALALVGTFAVRFLYETTTKDLVDISKAEPDDDELDKVVSSVEDLGEEVEEVVPEPAVVEEVKKVTITEPKPLSLDELLAEETVNTEASELMRDISYDRIEMTEYPSDEMARLLESRELPYSVRRAFSTEAEFMKMSSPDSIDTIMERVYSREDCAFGKEDEILDLKGLEELLSL